MIFSEIDNLFFTETAHSVQRIRIENTEQKCIIL